MQTLTSRVLGSFGWVLTNIAAKNVINFARTVVLWRLLGARDFGLNSMAWFAINGFTLLQDMGFQQELIRRKEKLEAAISVTWYVNVVIRLLLYALLYAAAPAVAAHFREPEVTSILRVASLTIVLGSFGAANEALLRKNFQFKTLLVVETIELVVQCAVQIALAWYGLGVWSLVYGAIASAFARSACLWWLAPIRVGRFDWAVAKDMWHFGKHMTATTLIHWLNRNMDYYFVGRFLGVDALGFYTLAHRLSDTVSIYVARLLGSVLYPAYAEIGRDLERLRAAWLRSVKYAMLLLMPVGIGMMVFSTEIVLVFFREKCEVVIVPLAILTVSALSRGLGIPLGDLAKSVGKPAILTSVAFWQGVVMIPLLYLVTAWLALGLEPELTLVSCVISGATIFAILLSLRWTLPQVSCTWTEVGRALLPCAVASAAMATAGWGGRMIVYSLAATPSRILVLVIFGALSTAAYCAAVWIAFPGIAREVKGLLRRGESSRAKAKQGA